jgi:hypothetical protein
MTKMMDFKMFGFEYKKYIVCFNLIIFYFVLNKLDKLF